MSLSGKTICVFCASSPKTLQKYREDGYRLGAVLAQKGAGIICGAGCEGLMQAVTNGALEAGGKVTGVIPEFMVEKFWHHPNLTEMITTKDMHSRKETMSERSDAVIALPGGVGTFEELLEIITWRQLGIYGNPIVILNTDGYYNALLQLLDHAIEEYFMSPENRELWYVADTVEQAVEYLDSHDCRIKNPVIEKY